jgi:hypothetical protein
MHMPIFYLTLQPTYYKKGFFNVTVDYDRFVKADEGQIELRLGASGRTVYATVNRKENRNGTARIHGGAALRDWFQEHFKPMETVAVDLSAADVIVLDRP